MLGIFLEIIYVNQNDKFTSSQRLKILKYFYYNLLYAHFDA